MPATCPARCGSSARFRRASSRIASRRSGREPVPLPCPRGAGRRRHLRTVHRRAGRRAPPVSSPPSVAREPSPRLALRTLGGPLASEGSRAFCRRPCSTGRCGQRAGRPRGRTSGRHGHRGEPVARDPASARDLSGVEGAEPPVSLLVATRGMVPDGYGPGASPAGRAAVFHPTRTPRKPEIVDPGRSHGPYVTRRAPGTRRNGRRAPPRRWRHFRVRSRCSRLAPTDQSFNEPPPLEQVGATVRGLDLVLNGVRQRRLHDLARAVRFRGGPIAERLEQQQQSRYLSSVLLFAGRFPMLRTAARGDVARSH